MNKSTYSNAPLPQLKDFVYKKSLPILDFSVFNSP